ncbi:Ger(x)C family spore germination C-terminal domain-containing protein [Gottfriedia acidiceleris]|uniref:Ger(x)C family spore germination C-terminal domain-containing protein n=1 Tax=Gottfriedia acidiceleris TaxID=371036 RepID=UPI003D1A14BD
MKKTAIVLYIILLFPLLTGCWDQLPLRKLKMMDVAGLNLNESGEVELHKVESTLKTNGQGNGDVTTVITVAKGPSLLLASGNSSYSSHVVYGVSNRLYLLSEKFALEYPTSEMSFLLTAPYSSINSPVVIFEGNLPKYMKDNSKKPKGFTDELNDYILTSEKRRMIQKVTMMDLLLSQEEILEDLSIPVIRQSDNAIELDGAYLYSHGKNTGVKLSKDQVTMMMLLLGKHFVRLNLTGDLTEKNNEKKISNHEKKSDYGFSVKEINSNFTVSRGSKELPTVTIKVRLKVYAYDLGTGIHLLSNTYINQKEKELSKHLEEMAKSTIESMQKANSDAIGIGKEIKANHPNIWNLLSWSKDYPRISIQPKFEVEILNSN